MFILINRFLCSTFVLLLILLPKAYGEINEEVNQGDCVDNIDVAAPIQWKKDIVKTSSINELNSSGLTRLHVAAKNGDINIVASLVKQGADINILTQTNDSRSSYGDVISMLIKHGANIQKADKNNWTPLQLAVRNGDISSVRIIMRENKKKRHHNFGSNTSPLFWAVHNSDSSMVRTLIEYGFDIKKTDKYGISPLHWAAYNGDKEIVSILVENGANPDQAASLQNMGSYNQFCESPLHWGIYNCDKDIVRILIELGANINLGANDSNKERCFSGETILYKALHSCNDEFFKWLLEMGADLKSQKRNYDFLKRSTPMFYEAMRNGRKKIVKLIIEKDFVIDIGDKPDEKSVLHLAAYSGSAETVEMLIGEGYEVNAVDKFGWTPLHWAVYKNGLIPDCPYGKKTALHLAASGGYLDVVKFLIEKGADVNILDESGRKAIHIAATKGYTEIVEFLKDG